LTGRGKSPTKGGAKNKNAPLAVKPFLQYLRRLAGGKLFGLAGWLLALALGCWATPRLYHQFITHVPSLRRENWQQTLMERQRELAVPWQDRRPLVLLAGDSHIEYGNWYALFAGGWAVRNCGLASATIADVTALVSAIGDPHPRMVVLMCGVNNLWTRPSIDVVINDYERLLNTVRSHLHPESIIVLSIMPLRESRLDRASHEFNMHVAQFNVALKACCLQHQVMFLNVNPAVTDARGGLAEGFTVDGLHLNAAGYGRLAGMMAPHLPPPVNAP